MALDDETMRNQRLAVMSTIAGGNIKIDDKTMASIFKGGKKAWDKCIFEAEELLIF